MSVQKYTASPSSWFVHMGYNENMLLHVKMAVIYLQQAMTKESHFHRYDSIFFSHIVNIWVLCNPISNSNICSHFQAFCRQGCKPELLNHFHPIIFVYNHVPLSFQWQWILFLHQIATMCSFWKLNTKRNRTPLVVKTSMICVDLQAETVGKSPLFWPTWLNWNFHHTRYFGFIYHCLPQQLWHYLHISDSIEVFLLLYFCRAILVRLFLVAQ